MKKIENSKRNITIEKVQSIFFAIVAIVAGSIIFIDYRTWELVLITGICVTVCFVLERMKDKDSQKAYDEYADWELENLERYDR